MPEPTTVPASAGAPPRRVVPLTMGSPSYRCVDLGGVGIRVTEALFPARTVLPMHAHERTVLAVMLEGGFDLAFARTSYDCTPGTVFVEPADVGHANTIGATGARPLVLEIAAGARAELPRPGGAVLGRPQAFRDGAITPIARRLQREMRRADASSRLAIEALALELLAAVARLSARDADARAPSGWVVTVRDLLQEHLDGPIRITDIARQVGVHRVHLGRVFRARYGESIGTYHRRVRIEWAARQLLRGQSRVADVAQGAGFADQSHFTRFFRRIMGLTPHAYREQHRRRFFAITPAGGAADQAAS